MKRLVTFLLVGFFALSVSSASAQATKIEKSWPTLEQARAATGAPYWEPTILRECRPGAGQKLGVFPTNGIARMTLPADEGGMGYVRIKAGDPAILNAAGFPVKHAQCCNDIHEWYSERISVDSHFIPLSPPGGETQTAEALRALRETNDLIREQIRAEQDAKSEPQQVESRVRNWSPPADTKFEKKSEVPVENPTPTKKSWWQRNKKWAKPVIGTVVVAAVVVPIAVALAQPDMTQTSNTTVNVITVP